MRITLHRNESPFVQSMVLDIIGRVAFVIQKSGAIKVPTGPGSGISYDEEIWKQAEKL